LTLSISFEPSSMAMLVLSLILLLLLMWVMEGYLCVKYYNS
jgi:hypothetical protein